MLKKPFRITRISTIGLLLAVVASSLWAQTASSPAGQTTSQPVGARRGKSHQQTCDGALDIVPVKAATFARKRKPSPRSDAAATEPRQEKR